jgi:hypothetical protein
MIKTHHIQRPTPDLPQTDSDGQQYVEFSPHAPSPFRLVDFAQSKSMEQEAVHNKSCDARSIQDQTDLCVYANDYDATRRIDLEFPAGRSASAACVPLPCLPRANFPHVIYIKQAGQDKEGNKAIYSHDMAKATAKSYAHLELEENEWLYKYGVTHRVEGRDTDGDSKHLVRLYTMPIPACWSCRVGGGPARATAECVLKGILEKNVPGIQFSTDVNNNKNEYFKIPKDKNPLLNVAWGKFVNLTVQAESR